MYELKTCSVCGATELKRIGVEEKDGQVFGVYKCPSCDTQLSAYEKFLKTVKKATSVAPQPEVAEEKITPPTEEAPRRTAVVNIAADVYKKAIGSTVALGAVIDNYSTCGTGTLISDNGYYVTNAHVVAKLSDDYKRVVKSAECVYCETEGKYRFVCDVVYVDAEYDLALLKTDPFDEGKTTVFSYDDVMPGQNVYAIGNSKGEGLCIMEGIVSDINRKIDDLDYIMITAPVTQGNSGGPVFDSDGKLIGIVRGGHNDTNAMNYIIPIERLVAFLEEAESEEKCYY